MARIGPLSNDGAPKYAYKGARYKSPYGAHSRVAGLDIGLDFVAVLFEPGASSLAFGPAHQHRHRC